MVALANREGVTSAAPPGRTRPSPAWRGAELVGLIAIVEACGPHAPAPPEPPPATPLEVDAEEVRSADPEWRYHPSRHGRLHDGVRLPDGSWLLVGERGERWLARPMSDGQGTTTAETRGGPVLRARAGAMRLGETLRSVVRTGDHNWLFVGETGTVFSCKAPLGPCTRATRPPEPLTRVVGAGEALVGITPAGRLWRYRQGSGWRDVPDLAHRIFDIARSADGALLGLTSPEQLLASRDAGLSWTVLRQAPSVATQRMVTAADGGVLVEGAFRTMYWDGASEGLGDPRGRTPAQLPLGGDWLIVPERGPRTSALMDRQAAITGRHYYEAFESAGERIAQAMSLRALDEMGTPAGDETAADRDMARWLWASGPLHEPLEVRPFPMAEGCDSIRLAAHQRRLVLACIHFDDDGDQVAVELSASVDGGVSWRPRATVGAIDTALVAAAVAADGTALLTGACPVGEDPCEPLAPLRLSLDAAHAPIETRAPGLISVPRSPLLSPDGSDAYFLGRRAKDEQIALFVSRDGARTFASRPLTAPRTATHDPERPSWDLEEDSPFHRLHLGSDGQLGIVLGGDPPAYLLADRDGRIYQVADLPRDTLAVSGDGASVLALASGTAEDGDPDRLTAWESRDGGLTFRRTAITPSLRIDEFESVTLRCARVGCVVEDRATRLGWGNGGEAGTPPSLTLDDPRPPLEPAVRPPFECELDPATGWSTLSDVAFGARLPGVSQAMRGNSAWSLLRYEQASGRVEALSVDTTSHDPRPRTQELLAPTRRPSRVAHQVVPQMEGYAAARLPLAQGHPQGSRGGPLEVAWIDFVHGYAARATLPANAAPPEVAAGEPPTLVTGLLSVSPRGLFVRPRPRSPETYFVDRRGAVAPPEAYPTWPSPRGRWELQLDAVMSGATPFAVAMIRNNEGHLAGVGLARLGATAATPLFASLAPPYDPGRQVETGFGYAADAMGITVHAVDVSSGEAWATFSPLDPAGGFGPTTALPTQLELGDPPRACDAAARRGTPRMTAPFVAGTRHPVLVRSLAESHVLLTDWAVLHGTQSAPCVAGWTAIHLQRSATAPMAAIIGAPLGRAWLFRPAPGRPGAVDYRPMRCKPSPSSPIPRQIWLEAGAMQRRR